MIFEIVYLLWLSHQTVFGFWNFLSFEYISLGLSSWVQQDYEEKAFHGCPQQQFKNRPNNYWFSVLASCRHPPSLSSLDRESLQKETRIWPLVLDLLQFYVAFPFLRVVCHLLRSAQKSYFDRVFLDFNLAHLSLDARSCASIYLYYYFPYY